MSTLAGTFEELTRLIRAKHQAGRHDQSTHNPYKGRAAAASVSGGTPVTMEWLGEPIQQMKFDRYYEPEQKRLKQALIDGNVMQEDMEGLWGFHDQPPQGRGYNYDHEGVLIKKGMPIAGVYDNEGKAIHISKRTLYGDPQALSKTVVHEMGHHVVNEMGWAYRVSRKGAGNDVIKYGNLKQYSNDQLANAGLRTYSLTSGGELLADTFVVMRTGTPDQKALLANIWSEANFDSLEQIYRYKQMLFVHELKSRYNDDGTIDTVLTPTIISRDIYEKTPWYYVDAI
jgi:hypothetical protein